MAHVRVYRTEEDKGAPWVFHVEVDGISLDKHIYNEGFGLVQVGEGDFAEWGVQMIVAADTLDVDLPDAVIEAVRKSDAEMAGSES